MSDIDFGLARAIADEIFDSFRLFKVRHSYQQIKIDPFAVKVAVTSYLKDLKRYSLFHNSPDPNEFKLAGYLVYWLVKLKVISSTELDPPEFQINSKYLAANEEFAIFLALNIMGIKASHIPNRDFISRLVYALYYRDITSKALVLEMELLYNTVPAHLRQRQVAHQPPQAIN